MYPILWQINSYILPSWYVFYLAASMSAWISLRYWAPIIWPEGNSQKIDILFICGYIANYLGARGLSLYLEDPEACFCLESFISLFQVGSMTLYGGVIGATVAMLLCARYFHLPVRQLADLTLPSTLLAVAIGRIGCLLNGDDYGRAVFDQQDPSWWAIKFPNLEDGIYRYPVQIWESLLCVSLVWICWVFRGRAVGVIGSTGILGYAIWRFILEFYRGDERGQLLSQILSPAQVLSLFIILIWLIFLYGTRVRKNGDYSPLS